MPTPKPLLIRYIARSIPETRMAVVLSNLPASLSHQAVLSLTPCPKRIEECQFQNWKNVSPCWIPGCVHTEELRLRLVLEWTGKERERIFEILRRLGIGLKRVQRVFIGK